MSKVPSLHWWSCLRWSCMASEQVLSRGCQPDYAHQLLQLLQRHWNGSCCQGLEPWSSPCPWSLELHVHVMTFSLFACLTALNPEFITGFHPLGTFASKCHRSTFCCLPTRIVASNPPCKPTYTDIFSIIFYLRCSIICSKKSQQSTCKISYVDNHW